MTSKASQPHPLPLEYRIERVLDALEVVSAEAPLSLAEICELDAIKQRLRALLLGPVDVDEMDGAGGAG